MDDFFVSVQTLLTVISLACAIVFGYAAFARNKKKDDTQNSANSATMLSDLGYLKANTDDIKSEQKKQRELNTNVLCRLSVVEERADRTDARLSNLEKGGTHNEN